ncbi:STAS/SEC14 domain-containing protein [Spirosoma sp. KUDC1026]|uniref:STAS/SEC14 domain-containing protein n=1 Tax=Spirosoma sp. KUDC1026 TaxID=2745947 RepID=UPI00159BD486|nr:STAS/SEC14 domain-containing protein [Spirosoma sp. KUDC1026]QKZ11535.1 STAS/SEC14 domain-containing protein [Spirosoma sp. KUDC1026]
MITPIDLQADNVIGCHIEGTVTAAELQSLYDQLTPRLEQHDKMRVYAEYIEIDGIEWEALWKDLKFDLAHLTDFEKAAVVTDKAWVGLSARLANIVPGLDVKFFKFSEQEQARQWVKN